MKIGKDKRIKWQKEDKVKIKQSHYWGKQKEKVEIYIFFPKMIILIDFIK